MCTPCSSGCCVGRSPGVRDGEVSVKQDAESTSLSESLQVAPGLTQSVNHLCAKHPPPTPEGCPLTLNISPLCSGSWYLISPGNSGCPMHPPPPCTHLAAFTRADPIVVARGLVIAHEARLVDPRRWWGRGRAGHHLLRASALRLHRWGTSSMI